MCRGRLELFGAIVLLVCLLSSEVSASPIETPLLLYLVEVVSVNGASTRHGWFVVPLGEAFSIRSGQQSLADSFALELRAERIDEHGFVVTMLSIIAIGAQTVAASTSIRCEPGVRTCVGSVSTDWSNAEAYITVGMLDWDDPNAPVVLAANLRHLGNPMTAPRRSPRAEIWLQGSSDAGPSPMVCMSVPVGKVVSLTLSVGAASGLTLGISDTVQLRCGLRAFADVVLVRTDRKLEHKRYEHNWQLGLELSDGSALGRASIGGRRSPSSISFDVGKNLTSGIWVAAGIGATHVGPTTCRLGLIVDF